MGTWAALNVHEQRVASSIGPMEAQFSKFGSPNFDVVQWVNQTVEFGQRQESVDAFLSTHVMKLQLLGQEVSSALEQTSAQLQYSLPKSVREIETTKREVSALQSSVAAVVVSLTQVEGDTLETSTALAELDRVRHKITQASETLRHAEHLISAQSRVNEVLGSGELLNIAELLDGMQQSIESLSGLPEFADAQKQVDAARAQLSSLVGPQMDQALAAGQLDQIGEMVLVCRKMGQPALFEGLYVARAVAHIEELCPAQSTSAGSPVPVASFELQLQKLASFYDQVLRWAFTEQQNAVQAFPDQATVVIRAALTKGLLSVAPKLAEQVSGNTAAAPLEQLESLTAVVAVVTHFMTSLNELLGDRWDQQLAGAGSELLVPLIDRYCDLEKQLLLAAAEGWVQPGEVPEVIEQSIEPFVEACSKARERCVTISGCSKAVEWVEVVNCAIERYCKVIHKLVADACTADQSTEVFTQLNVAMQSITQCKTMHKKLHGMDLTMRSQFKPRLVSLIEAHKDGSGPLRYLQLDRVDGQLAELEGLFEIVANTSTTQVLSQGLQQVRSMIERVEGLVTAVMFQQVETALTKFVKLPVWSEAGSSTSDKGIALPSFSCSPLEYITSIGEHLLVLPQHLEAYAPREQEGHFVHTWISKLARMTADLYIGQLLTIPRLSPSGSAQLAADMQYLVNVLKALAIEPHPKLLQSIEALQASQQELEQSYANSKSAQLLKAVALKRGF